MRGVLVCKKQPGLPGQFFTDKNHALFQSACFSGSNQGITHPSGTAEVCLKQFYLNDAPQGIPQYRSCTCKPEYNKTCSGDDLTPDLYVGLSSDYCEISAVDDDGSVTTSKKYKQCQCPTNFGTCPSGTQAPDIASLSAGQYCIEVAANGSKTTKFVPEVCACVATAPGAEWNDSGLVDTAAETTYNSDGAVVNNGAVQLNKSKLNTSNQDALKRRFLEECGHEKNGLVKGNGCGKLYYKCLIDPADFPYSDDNCAAPKTLQGASSTKSGWDGSVTLREKCDCDTSKYKYSNDDECINYYSAAGGASSSNHKLFCTAANYSSTPYSARVTCGSVMFKIDSTSGCTFNDGTTKYSACTCKKGGEAISGNACISAYCGLPSQGGDDYACWANDKRISVYNGGGANNDATCKCPQAQITRDLDGCSGKGYEGGVTRCNYL